MLGGAVAKDMWAQRASRAPLYSLGAVVAMMVALLIGALTARSAHAETFTVDTTEDRPITTIPVTGSCTSADNDCPLRWALEDTATTNGQTDTINFASDVRGTITLTNGQLTIVNDSPASDFIINGPGAGGLTVSGNNASRDFEIASGAGATINGVTISNGKLTGSPFGAGIFNGGTLTLNNTVVSANTADSAGGGIYNSGGNLTLSNSKVSGNKSIFTLGGGIYNNSGTVTLNNTVVSGNFANNGGGIRNTTPITTPPSPTATLTLTNSTVSGNSTNNDGGGINSSNGTVTLTNSTVSGNTSEDDGGGIEFSGTTANTLTVTNSTVSGNSTDDKGGGIGNGGTLRITNSTVTNNTASDTTSNTGSGGGIFNYSGANATPRNTIVAANKALVAAPDVGEASPMSYTSQGNNLIGNTSGSSGWVASDLQNRNPLLGPLQNNGGPTATHALWPGSPAIDRAANAGCSFTDQRGVVRKDGDGNGTVICDIGAYERSDFTSPKVSSTTPTNGATAVRRNANLTATFSEKMTRSTLSTTTFKLLKVNSDGSTTQITNVTVSSGTDGLRATLNPFGTSSTLLGANTTYRAVVTTGVRDLAGNQLDQSPTITGKQPMVWTFKTGST